MDFITQRMKLKNAIIRADFEDLQKKYEFDDSTEFIRKGLVPEDLKFEEGERAVIEYITTAIIDRDGEVVNPKGCILKEYRNNPVVLFGHDSRSLPIGRSDWQKTDDKGLLSKTVYASHPFADQVYQYRKEGFPLASSIGFIPLKTTTHAEGSEERAKGIKRTYDKWLLLEYSNVPVPSNPEALALAVSKGLLTDKEAQEYIVIINTDAENKDVDGGGLQGTPPQNEDGEKYTSKPSLSLNLDGYTDDEISQIKIFAESLKIDKPGWDETEDMIRHRVREPGLFVDGSFRTVPIKRDKPKVNAVMGKLKTDADPKPMKVQNLMFPKTDGWTMAQAKKWVSDHPELMKWLEDEAIVKVMCSLADEWTGLYEPGLSIEDKSGRTLSASTRKTMTAAVDAMNNAVTALTELLNTADTKPEDEGKDYVIIEQSEIKEEGFNIDYDINEIISGAVKRALPQEINIKDVVKEGLCQLTGKV